MKKKICSLLLALLMVVTMLPVTAMASNSYYINGKTVHYDDFASSPNECWVYANNIYNKIWGQRFSNDFGDANNSLRNLSDSELTLTSAHLKAYVSNAKLGAVLRICNSEYLHGSDGWGHSQIIVQKDSNGFTVFEGGLSASPYCREKYYTWGGYLNSYSYAYIKYIKWPGASAYVDSHTCDKGSYVYYEAAHPHYKCYKCSICGKVWRDTSAPTKLTNCEQCYPRTATVTYYNADGAVWTTASGTADTSYTLNASYPTKSGSYFVGWSYTAGTSSFDLRPNDTVTLKGSIDLYPVYVTHEEAVSGEEVYIYDINDFDSEGYNISSEDHTVQTRVDNSGWTSWSNYSLTAATESATQQVRTTKMYRYYYFLCPSCGRHEPFTGKSDCGATISGGAWHEGWFDTPYSACNPQSFSYTTSKYYTTSLGDGQVWIFSAGNLNDTSVGTTDATGSASVIETGYSTRQWVTKFNTVDRTATAYRITKAALASGTCGENLTWILDENGTLTISGTGAMTSPVWWNSYKDSIKTVVIKDGVTTIEEGAFEDCENLTSITIPASVTKIGDYAFENCTNLTHASIKSSVVSIGRYAFNNCEGLANITISGSLTKIGDYAFSGCSNLTDVYYDGTEEQWKQVKIDNGNDANYLLNAATIHFKEPEPQPPVETSGTIAVSSVRARAGQTVTVKVDLSANKGISNMRLQMSYPKGFTLESIQKGDALSTLFFTPPGKLTANPVNFVWDGTEADMSEGCILELTFRIADTVAVGEYSISLSYQKDDVLDGSLEGIDLALQSGTVSVVEFTRGDIDDDGVIGMKDLGALRKYFAGGYDTEKFVMEAADLDGDGVVTMKDLGVLRRYLAGGYDINLGE
mgnify:CR=1 FL=1